MESTIPSNRQAPIYILGRSQTLLQRLPVLHGVSISYRVENELKGESSKALCSPSGVRTIRSFTKDTITSCNTSMLVETEL